MDVSIVIPLYNEVENVEPLYEAVEAVISKLDRSSEVVLVDDGSLDGTGNAIKSLAAKDRRFKVVSFRGNFGQTAAMEAGLHAATGDVVVTLDGDLQNDPGDIPMMLTKLDEGFDLVHGWRKDRQDALLHRKVPSWIANGLISWVTKVPVHDLGCTLKAMRREVAQELNLVGEMHRFIPILAAQRGARCAEVVTRHHPRTRGVSKYGMGRVFRVLLDLMTVHYLTKYLASPMKLFGMAGFCCAGVAAISGTTTVAMKLGSGIDMTGNPMLLLTALSIMAGVQFFAIGLLGELITRIYFQSRGVPPYAVREKINFDSPDEESHDVGLKAAA
ncbi:glycosyltransferase family 2 protein [Stratiformator vulcanicus]|uniref:Undecaprenyl-phosphate 4-deoxy-4-formamido-L-arabinose transferase n=1 Tax=Stratiformator vulcanicus TaxID=2527980 RepID=A0A517R6M4_9PLAN|nr:glycosyltransferase family 2 protein [Stratiformator vulcanicus]QDT39530.1 Undecaprenyl-phosphate 4-deoxy-4-formamido-L-arabinose transferase [Stratiformator vulcanicus]